jgi:hypothetical protein
VGPKNNLLYAKQVEKGGAKKQPFFQKGLWVKIRGKN